MTFIDVLIVAAAATVVIFSVRSHMKARRERKRTGNSSGCSGCAYSNMGACESKTCEKA